MEKQQLLEKFTTYQKKLNALELAITTMSFDLNTIAPKKGGSYRFEAMSTLDGQYFETSISPDYIGTLLQLKELDLDDLMKREIELRLISYNKNKNIPVELATKFSLATNESFEVWQEAKKQNDYSLFEPHLKNVVALRKEMISYQDNVTNTYEAMLDNYEQGLTQQKVNDFFKVIQERLVPFIQQVVNKKIAKPEFLSRTVSIDKQRQITELIRNYLDFNPEYSYISESAHPFSSTFSINDTRITTKYLENDFTSNIFSIIHEIGHGTYNHQVDSKYEGYAIADSMSMSLHESQSRFLENNIGRSYGFWYYLYPQLQEILKEELADVSLDEFVFGINYSEPSLIRIEADELTYPLHILIRYNMEQRMINENITDNLDVLWADEYEKILGIRPATHAEGILQDVHWSDASFGYFPTYALGSAYACQFYNKMSESINIEEELKHGNFVVIKEWLKENIHQYGGYYLTEDIIFRVTGQSFDPVVYCDYLIEKFTKLFNI